MAASKNFLITGAGRGIGRGLSRLLLQSCHRVFLVDNDTAELNHTAARLSQSHAQGKDFEIASCDLRRPAEITAAATTAGKWFDGKLDCLINNAAFTGGVGGVKLEDDAFFETWTASLETNLTGSALMTRACLPLLRRAGGAGANPGSIIFISSTRAFMSEPHNEPYSSTKAALLGLSQSLSISLAPDAIRSNVILPGWIHVGDECKEADENGTSWEEGLSKDDHAWHSTGRVGKVDDIFQAVVYLSNNAGVSGTEVVVDGGVTRRMVYPE